MKGGRNASEFYTEAFNLAPGEALIIERKEWRQKASPGRMIGALQKKHKRKYIVRALSDKSGWGVKREV